MRLHQLSQFFYVLFLIFLHLFPERFALRTVTSVILVHLSDTPQALVLLGKLVDQIVQMVVKHTAGYGYTAFNRPCTSTEIIIYLTQRRYAFSRKIRLRQDRKIPLIFGCAATCQKSLFLHQQVL